MHARTYLIIAALAIMAIMPAPANANGGHGDLEADVQAAHDYWNSAVCDRQWVITPDHAAATMKRGGAATGIAFTYNPTSGSYTDERGERWDWHSERCEITIDPQYQGCQRRDLVRHEIGHFIHGPGHTGRMAPETLGADSYCLQPISPHASPVAAPQPRRARPSRRSRAQIARSMRYKRQIAKIRARAYARGTAK